MFIALNWVTNMTLVKKSSNNRHRQRTISCRVLPDEFERIQRRAQEIGVSTSQLLRDAALSARVGRARRRVPTRTDQLLARAVGQLSGIAVALRALAKTTPSVERGDSDRLGELTCELETLMLDLLDVTKV